MKAVQSGVKDVLEGAKQYVLPLYQRRYSWGTKHWSALWRDLERLLEQPQRRSHFIGSFVTAPLDHAADQSVNRYRLIDGQQRLTTLLLALAALRDVARSKGRDDLAAEIGGLYLSNQYKKGEAARKLLPTLDDRDEFFAVIDGQSRAGRIGDAYRYFAEHLDRLPVARLDEARHAALGRLAVVSITLESDDDPHLIFESLNAKGERLTEGDLLRNYFLMRLPQGEADEHFARLWRPMQAELGEDVSGFFRHYLMRDPEAAEVRKNEVYFGVKELVDARAADAAAVVGVLEDVRRHAGFYARLVAPQAHESDPTIAARLERLHRLKVTTAYPFLLTLMDAVDAGRLSTSTLAATLDLIEAFLVRRAVCGVPTNQLRNIFRGLCPLPARAAGDAAFIAAVRASISMGQRCPNDAAFADAIARRPLYGGAKNDVARYLLERIERAAGHKESPDPAAANVQLEHVMPQKLTDAWREELGPTQSGSWSAEPLLGDEGPSTRSADAAHAQWLHTLGNLTLTGYNPELGNQPFAQKRARFAQSNFSLNEPIAAAARWDVDAIADRGRALARQAVALWPDVGAGLEEPKPAGAKRARAANASAVVFDGERTAVASTLDATHVVLERLHARDAARFRAAVERTLPAARLARSADGLRAPRAVGDAFVDLHGSSAWLERVAKKVALRAGLPPDAVRFEFPAGGR